MTTNTTINDASVLGSVLNGAGETTLTSVIITQAGSKMHPDLDPFTGKVNSGYFQVSDANGRFLAMGAANGQPAGKNLIGAALTFAGNLILDSCLTGGVVSIITV